MANYETFFDDMGLRAWCDQGSTDGPMSMSQLLASVEPAGAQNAPKLPFPSLDALAPSLRRHPTNP